MAYNAQHLSVLAYADRFTLWYYRSSDTCAEIRNIDYFSADEDMIQPNDLIIYSGIDGNGFTFHIRVPK